MIKAGLALEQFRSRNLADKKLPGAYQYLNTYAVGEVLEALKHPETSVWAKIFHWCHRQRHHPAGGLCGHHVNHL